MKISLEYPPVEKKTYELGAYTFSYACMRLLNLLVQTTAQRHYTRLTLN